MITMWEIHVSSKHSIGDIIAYLKTKGIASDFRLCKDGYGKLKVKHPQTGNLHNFSVKLYDEIGDVFEYEFGAWTEAEFNYLKDIAKDL